MAHSTFHQLWPLPRLPDSGLKCVSLPYFYLVRQSLNHLLCTHRAGLQPFKNNYCSPCTSYTPPFHQRTRFWVLANQALVSESTPIHIHPSLVQYLLSTCFTPGVCGMQPSYAQNRHDIQGTNYQFLVLDHDWKGLGRGWYLPKCGEQCMRLKPHPLPLPPIPRVWRILLGKHTLTITVVSDSWQCT